MEMDPVKRRGTAHLSLEVSHNWNAIAETRPATPVKFVVQQMITIPAQM